MSEPIKTTLFTFASLRAPELLPEDSRNYYIDGSGTTGDIISGFNTYINTTNPTATPSEIRTELDSLASTFESTYAPLQVSEDFKSADSDKWEFAVWLSKNKKTLTDAEVTAEVGSVIGGSTDTLWDYLFYHIITMDDLATRQTLMMLIVAEYFLANYQSAPYTGDDDKLRKLADSRVMLPKEMFTVSAFFSNTSDNSSSVENSAVLDKYMSIAESKFTKAQIEKAIAEIKCYEDEYDKGFRSVAKAVGIAYDSAIDSALATAKSSGTTISLTDPFSNTSFDIYDTGFTMPNLGSISASGSIWESELISSGFDTDQITQSALTASSKISDETIYIIESNDLYQYHTFQQVYEQLEKLAQESMDNAFSLTPTGNDTMFVNGTELPTCSIENKINPSNSFFIKSFKKADDTYGLVMVVNTSSPCVKLNSMDISFDGELASTTLTKFESVNHKGIMTIDLTPNSNVVVTAGDINTDGELYLNDGVKLAWSSVNLDMTEGVKGTLTPDSLLVGNESTVFIPSGFGIRRLGISDYNKVEQTLCCYVAGEVSHIENILAKEYKERSTRRLRRSETTITDKTDYESENLTDTSSSSRFDMNQEVAEVISSSSDLTKDRSIHAGVSGKTGLGFQIDTSVDAGSSLSTNNSKENSNNQSVAISKEITEKASQRITNKVSSERTRKIIEEFEEQNKHGFDNRLGSEHISGVYRWVDKIYKNQIKNYGKRLQYEFMIPEPSSFHIVAKMAAANQGIGDKLVKPLDPRADSFGVLKPIASASEISASNYKQWAAAYNAEVSPPPAWRQVIGKTFSKSQGAGDGEDKNNKVASEDVALPAGYGISKVYVSARCGTTTTNSSISVSVADISKRFRSADVDSLPFLVDDEMSLYDKYVDSVPVSVYFSMIWGGQVSVSIELKRKPEAYAQWQLDTFNSIISAYEDKLAEYKGAKAEMDTLKSDFLNSNPKYYRDVEKTVLKKNCLSYLIGHTNLGQSFVSGSELRSLRVNITQEMDDYASMAKFFEQAFEWDNMSYLFYPFFWAGKDSWHRLYGYENNDSTFREFLQAGMARVQLTVRPGFENAVLHYMATGQIWNGGDVPVIGDDLYLSVSEEIKDTSEFTITDMWETRVPSTLTVVQAESLTLSATGLPCYCDDIETPPTETFGSSTAFPTVHVEGYTP